MFKKIIDKNFQKHQYVHTNGISFCISPEKGGILNELVLLDGTGKTCSLIDGYEKEINITDAYKSAVLLPFANRINKGKYSYSGVTYQLPINEDRLGEQDQVIQHALHGLLYDASWSIEKEELSSTYAKVILHTSYQSHHEGYPFSFDVSIHYSLSTNTNELVVSTEIKNTSNESIPMGYGFHPYLKIDDTPVDELSIAFDVHSTFTLDKYCIPTGEKKEYNAFKEGKKIASTEFDDCFELDSTEGRNVLHLSNQNAKVEFWQETGEKKYNFLQLYTPPHRESIAVEPMSSCIDTFNNQIGLIEINSNEVIIASFGIKLT